MLDHALTHLPSDRPEAVSLHDRVQIALAIADQPTLHSLLTHCTPPLTHAHRLGGVTASIGVPFEARRTVDGVVNFEVIHCVLANSPEEIEQRIAATTPAHLVKREYLLLTRCESETYSLGKHLSLAQAIAILRTSGFSPEQVDEIVHLPASAWHRSWWYSSDEQGYFTQPFLRTIRTIRFTDGTFELQYKDYFAQNKPLAFTSQNAQVLVEIKTEHRSFRKTLDHINLARAQLGIPDAILICDDISDLEARGFISQGISIYNGQPLALQAYANCQLCANRSCPLNGSADSGVTLCRRFCLEATSVT